MTQVDQFESIFRSALVDVYEYKLVDISSVLLVTDRKEAEVQAYLKHIQRFLGVLGNSVSWDILGEGDFATTRELLDHVDHKSPDLICSYRNLFSTDWQYPHSLGSNLDVLIQKTDVPVLVLPHPAAGYATDHALENTDTVMAITDHLSSDHRLVNYAVRFSHVEGKVFLTHIEDEKTFDRYINAISKIPTIDTDEAKKAIREQLLKEPRQYIESCRQVLEKHNISVDIERIVVYGRSLSSYKQLISEHNVDLLVMNSRDEDQSAMHGIAYPLAVELRHIPLLMI